MNNKNNCLKIGSIVLMVLDALFFVYFVINIALTVSGMIILNLLFSILTYIVLGVNVVSLVVLLTIYFSGKVI